MKTSNKNYYIGVDIGGTNTVAGLVDSEGHILKKDSFPTAGHPDFSEYILLLARSIDSLADLAPGIVAGVGVGAPAVNSLTGDMISPVNLCWGTVNIPDVLSPLLRSRLTVRATNDANAAALGEKTFGAARDLTDFIELTLGTGVGSGIFTGGTLLMGANGLAGELGHLRYAACGPRSCACGRTGCLDAWCSARGLETTTRELIARHNLSTSLQADRLTSYDIFVAASQGDSLAREAFRITGEVLGNAIADMVTFSDPQAVILFGGLANSGDMLLSHVRDAFRKNALYLFSDVKILLSEIPENDAAILGAAACVAQL